MSEREIVVNVTDSEVAELTALGFWNRDGDGVLVLTPEGNAWVSEWCKRKLAALQSSGGDASP